MTVLAQRVRDKQINKSLANTNVNRWIYTRKSSHLLQLQTDVVISSRVNFLPQSARPPLSVIFATISQTCLTERYCIHFEGQRGHQRGCYPQGASDFRPQQYGQVHALSINVPPGFTFQRNEPWTPRHMCVFLLYYFWSAHIDLFGTLLFATCVFSRIHHCYDFFTVSFLLYILTVVVVILLYR